MASGKVWGTMSYTINRAKVTIALTLGYSRKRMSLWHDVTFRLQNCSIALTIIWEIVSILAQCVLYKWAERLPCASHLHTDVLHHYSIIVCLCMSPQLGKSFLFKISRPAVGLFSLPESPIGFGFSCRNSLALKSLIYPGEKSLKLSQTLCSDTISGVSSRRMFALLSNTLSSRSALRGRRPTSPLMLKMTGHIGPYSLRKVI